MDYSLSVVLLLVGFKVLRLLDECFKIVLGNLKRFSRWIARGIRNSGPALLPNVYPMDLSASMYCWHVDETLQSSKSRKT